MRTFAARGAVERCGARLIVAGPETDSIADDPEQQVVFDDVCAAWTELPVADRQDVHLVRLPMADLEENAIMVNALQSRADVVVQKSLVEGFGLTVTEAMWKARPVVAARVGGIQDQIVHGRDGFLVEDPRDEEGFGRAIVALLGDRSRARELGRAADERVCQEFLPLHHFRREAGLLKALLAS